MNNPCWDWISRALLRAAIMRIALVAAFGLGVVATLPSQAQTFTLLHSFNGASQGLAPTATLLRDAEGNLYGTTSKGARHGLGSVFKLDKAGKLTVLHAFTGGLDGATPYAGLIRDNEGNLYGTAFSGGGSSNCYGGCGIVFKLSPAGKETVLHRFAGGRNDGANPYAPLLRDAHGNLYGTTVYGGDGGGCNSACGVVFKLDAKGKETILYVFGGYFDGGYPFGGLVMDAQGNLYGTTEIGGALGYNYCPEVYCGTVFRLDPTGKETLLYQFTGGSDGAFPQAGVILDKKGNLFGTTFGGGDPSCEFGSGCGVVYKLDATGKETTLYAFKGSTDGGYPEAVLVRDAAGNFFSTTWAFGNTGCLSGGGCGVVFKVDKTGKETVLHSFAGNGTDGGNSSAGLIFDEQGNLYGTASAGGTGNAGTVFKITP